MQLIRVVAGFFSVFSLVCAACGPTDLAGTDLRNGKWLEFRPSEKIKASVVVFLSAKCPCSESHETKLTELAQTFPEFDFIGVHSNADEPLSEAQTYFSTRALPFPVLQDKETKIADRFGALKTPHAYVVGPRGECLYSGGVDDSKDANRAKDHFLKSALEAIRAGQSPKIKNARTLGCVIKRS